MKFNGKNFGARFSDEFGVDPDWLIDNSIFNPTLDTDSLLFIDPFLLTHSVHTEIKPMHLTHMKNTSQKFLHCSMHQRKLVTNLGSQLCVCSNLVKQMVCQEHV